MIAHDTWRFGLVAETANEGAVWPITRIKIGERSRKRLGDVAALMASIKSIGLLHPIVVRPDGQLVAGYRRLQAVQRLGWHDCEVTIAHTVDDDVTTLRAEADENTCREAWSVADVAAHAKRERPKEVKKARERQGKRNDLDPTCGQVAQSSKEPARARDAVAAATGVAPRTLEKIEQVYAAAENDKTMMPVVAAMEEDDKVDSAHKIAQWSKADRREHAKLWDWGWSNGDVVRFRGIVEQFPEDEQYRARSLVVSEETPLPGSIAKKAVSNVLSMTAKKRQHIYKLHESDDERDRATACSLAVGNPPQADPRLARIVEMARELRKLGKSWPDESPSQMMTAAATALDRIAEGLRDGTRERAG